MRGYPKTIGCKQDIINLEKDYPKESKATLERIETFDKANLTVVKVVSGSEETKDLVTQTITNPSLLSVNLGFKNVKEVTDKIAALSAAAVGEVEDGK